MQLFVFNIYPIYIQIPPQIFKSIQSFPVCGLLNDPWSATEVIKLMTEYEDICALITKDLSNDRKHFKTALKRYLLDNSFHSLEEYFNQNMPERNYIYHCFYSLA